MVEYRYDAWGNHVVLNSDGNEITYETNIGLLNPFRYRSYYYDTETGLYYLKSRYYDSTVCRFINIDSTAYADPKTINGLNLYAYCKNNPVMNVDPNGTEWWNPATWDWGAVYDWTATLVGIFNLVGLIAGAVSIVVAACQGRWGDVVIDWNSGCFNPFNQSEDVAKKSKVFSFYKGEYVIRHSSSIFSSAQIFGTIFLNTSARPESLNHEWGHGIQEKLMGPAYLLRIALPSVITYWTLPVDTNYEKNYYSMPWERTADFFGGIDRGFYKKDSLTWALFENIFGIIVIPLYFIFGY